MSQPSRVSLSKTETAELDYLQILRGVLKRRKKIVIAVFILVGPPLVAWTLSGRRPTFESTATVLIKPSIVEMFPGARDLPVGSNLSVQMAVLRSRSLAVEVLKAVPQETMDELIRENLKTDYILVLTNATRRLLGKLPVVVSPREKAMAELQDARMTFLTLPGETKREPSGLVRITATAFRPRVAMDLVNTYIQVLVNWSSRSEQEDLLATRQFLEIQLARVRQNLKDSEASLTKFEDGHGVIRLTDQTQFEMARLAQLQGTLSQVQANEEVAQRKIKALQKALEEDSRNPSVSSDTRITAEAAQAISARLAQLEATLAQMRAKYTEEHPSLIAVREEIANLQSQLAQLPVTSSAGGPGGVAIGSRDEILRSLATVKADLAKFQAERESLRLQIDQTRQGLKKLGGREFEYSRLQGRVGSNRALADFLTEKLFALQVRQQGQGSVVKVIDPPSLPSAPIKPLDVKKLVSLVVFALGTAGGLGFLVEYVYQPIESEETIRQQVNLPFLGSALMAPRQPQGDGRPLLLFGQGRKVALPQEFYRVIRTNLEAANLQNPFKTIMFTSCFPGEGKSTTAINLAMTLRELGRRVILIDADLRKPRLGQILQSGTKENLVDLLQDPENAADVRLPKDGISETLGITSGSDFSFISGGNPPEDPAALLGSARAKEFISLLKQRWDYVLIDSPPVLLVRDNLLLAKWVDGVILVAHAGQTRKKDLNQAKELLEESGIRILGVILNQVSLKQVSHYYRRYRSYYAPYGSHQSGKS